MQTVPFAVMVKNLFKAEGYHQQFGAIVHAAIGVVGEVQELADSVSGHNTREECGDLEFYIEAATQAVEVFAEPLGVDFREMMFESSDRVTSNSSRMGAMHLRDMQSFASDFLDITKKLWVYGKSFDADVISYMAISLGEVRGNLLHFYAVTGLKRDEILSENQTKLGKRYPQGVYADADAQARADKIVSAAVEQFPLGGLQVDRKKTDDTEGGSHD